MSDAALAAEHRRALAAVSTLTVRDLRRVWRLAGTTDAVAVRDALMETVPLIGETYGNMAGALASDYYDEVRVRAQVPGRFRAQPAPLPGTARYEALVRWGVDPLFSPSPDQLAAMGRIGGGLQRIVTDVARGTVVDAATADPQAAGWRRVTASDACSFCKMLADRNAVYTEATVRFASHDACGCSAAPSFEPGRSVSVVAYTASKRNVTEADRARVREYLAGTH